MEENAKQDSKSPGAFGYFPWSPRIAQNLITNPTHITPKTVYSSPKPLREANQFNLTAKVQEISIDQTWFKRRERETIVDTKEEGHMLTGKGDAAEARSSEIEEIEIIEKQCAKESENKVSSVLSQLECEHVRSDTTKFGKVFELHSGNAPVNDNVQEQNEERLRRIEQLILPSEQFSDTKSVLEKTPTAVPRLRHTDSSSSTENTLGPDFVPVRDKHFVHSRSDSCTTSVCSTCSLISTLPSRSRCSSGDGCSSVECDGLHKTLCTQSEGIHKRNYTICYLHGPSYNPESVEAVGDQPSLTFDTSTSNRGDAENISPDVVDCSCGVERLSETMRHESRPLQSQRCLKQQNYDKDKIDAIGDLTERRHARHKKNLLSEMQLMFYIIRLQTSKFGELKHPIARIMCRYLDIWTELIELMLNITVNSQGHVRTRLKVYHPTKPVRLICMAVSYFYFRNFLYNGEEVNSKPNESTEQLQHNCTMRQLSHNSITANGAREEVQHWRTESDIEWKDV